MPTTEEIPDNNNIRNQAKTYEIIIQYEPKIQKNAINTRLNNKSSTSTSQPTKIQILNGNTKIDYCNSKIDKNELKSNFRPAPKNSGTHVHIRRTLSGNDTLLDGLAPQEGRTQK